MASAKSTTAVVAALILTAAARAEGPMPDEIVRKLIEMGRTIDSSKTNAVYAPLQQKEPYAGVRVERDVKYVSSPTPSGGLTTPTNNQRPIGTTQAANGYWEYLPVGYGGSPPSPLMVFWSGSGQDGSGNSTDLNLLNMYGPPMLISTGKWPRSRPFVVLSAQHISNNDCANADEIHNFITYAMQTYNIDPKRVYLTGLSCGAIGAALYLAKYSNQQVIASALISGDASYIWNSLGCGFLKGSALWSFHGDADIVVSISGDNLALPNFLACPQPHLDVRYTVYPGGLHDVWTKTYDLSSIYSWLLGFSK
jgi:predicted peptidase